MVLLSIFKIFNLITLPCTLARGGEGMMKNYPLNIGLENKRSFPEKSFWDAFYFNNFKILPFSKGKMHLPEYLGEEAIFRNPPRGERDW
jgi:hypothetical protein